MHIVTEISTTCNHITTSHMINSKHKIHHNYANMHDINSILENIFNTVTKIKVTDREIIIE